MVGGDIFVRPAGIHTNPCLTPKRGTQSTNSRVNSHGDGSGMRGRTDRADAHPAERCAESVRLDVKIINRVTLGYHDLQSFFLSHLFLVFIIIIIIIALDCDTRPFTVYWFNVRTRARKLIRVEWEKGCELTQSAGVVADREHGVLPLGAGRRRWCGE